MAEGDEVFAVIIDEDGLVVPFMDLFGGETSEDDDVVEAIKAHLGKVGRKLGELYMDGDDSAIIVVINQDRSVYPLEEVVNEANAGETTLIDVVRSELRRTNRVLGTARIPPAYLGTDGE